MNGAHAVDLTSGKSLETFIGESSETIKKTLGRYADNLAWVKTGPWNSSHLIILPTVPCSQRVYNSPVMALSKLRRYLPGET